MNKVLIVEDHALIRFGLKTAFENNKYIDEIYEAASGEEAIETVKNNKIDVVIMDLGLPLMNGIEASKEIKKLNKNVKIIVLTSHNNEIEVIESIKAGASAYCSKDIAPERLSDIIISVLDGALWFDAKVANLIIKTLTAEKKQENTEFVQQYNLTEREVEVLKYICDGLNNGEISKILDVSINTVKVHVSSIIQKLEVEDRTQVVVKAFKNSFV